MANGSIETRVNRKGEPRYRARIDVGRSPLTGRRRFETKTFRTRKAAEKWLRSVGNKLDEGERIEPSKEPLGRYLAHWLQTRTDLEPGTITRYDTCIRKHIAPAIGDVELGKLGGHAIQQLYNRLAGTSQPRIIRTILRQSLNQAAAEGLIPRNPSIGLKARGSARRPGDQVVWTVDQLIQFLVAADATKHGVLFRVLAATGLRVGEILALSWRDVDLVDRVVTVGGRTKTSTSRRQVAIDRETSGLLIWHRETQWRRLAQLDIEVDALTPVFDRGDGQRIQRAVVEWRMQRIIEQTGLPRLTPHGLRHTHASLLLAAGRPLHYVQRRLGHASGSTTIQYYAHVLPGTDHDDAELFSSILHATSNDGQSSDSEGSRTHHVPADTDAVRKA